MAARKGYNRASMLTDEHRAKIANSNTLNALIEHVEGRRDMSSTQVTAGVALLKKVMPDLAATDHTSGGEPLEAVRWLTAAEELPSSHTAQETSSNHSTNGHSDGRSLSATDEPVRQ
jgi:hypothetical protein